MQISRFSEVSCRKPPDAPYCLYRSLSETCKEEEDGPGRKDTDLGFQSLCTTSCVTPTDHLLWNSSSKVPLPPFNGKDCCWESEVPGFSFWTHPLSRKGKRESEFAKELALLSSIQVSALGCEAYAFVEVVRSKLLILPACFARLVIFKKIFFLQTCFLVILASKTTGRFLQRLCRNAGDAATGPWPVLVWIHPVSALKSGAAGARAGGSETGRRRFRRTLCLPTHTPTRSPSWEQTAQPGQQNEWQPPPPPPPLPAADTEDPLPVPRSRG